jgi:hypothetical protein
MTACLPLQDCIVQTTSLPAGNFCRRARVQITRLPAHGRIILPSRCMHTRAATWELPDCSGRLLNCMGAHVAALLQRQFLKLHTSALQSLQHLQWQDTKLHARGGCCPAAVAEYQTACARGCPAAVACSGASLIKEVINCPNDLIMIARNCRRNTTKALVRPANNIKACNVTKVVALLLLRDYFFIIIIAAFLDQQQSCGQYLWQL